MAKFIIIVYHTREFQYVTMANEKTGVLNVVEVKSAITANAKSIANLAEVAASATMANTKTGVLNVVVVKSAITAYAKRIANHVVVVQYVTMANEKASVLNVVEVKSAITANAKRIANLAEVAPSANRHGVKHTARRNTKACVYVVACTLVLISQSHGITRQKKIQLFIG
jgi:hypothetical protein